MTGTTGSPDGRRRPSPRLAGWCCWPAAPSARRSGRRWPPSGRRDRAPAPARSSIRRSARAGPGQTGRPDPLGSRAATSTPVDRTTGLAFDVDCGVGGRRPQRRRTPSATRPSRSPGPGRPGLPRTPRPGGAARRAGRERPQRGRSGGRRAVARPVREHFAVITVDLVGTGESGPIDCLSGYDARALMTLGHRPDRIRAAATALAELSRSLTFECGDLAGAGAVHGEQHGRRPTTWTPCGLRWARRPSTCIGPGLRRDARRASTPTGIRAGSGARCWTRRPTRWTQLDARAAAVAVAAEQALDTFAASCADFRRRLPARRRPAGRRSTEGGQHARRRAGRRPGRRHAPTAAACC